MKFIKKMFCDHAYEFVGTRRDWEGDGYYTKYVFFCPKCSKTGECGTQAQADIEIEKARLRRVWRRENGLD